MVLRQKCASSCVGEAGAARRSHVGTSFTPLLSGRALYKDRARLSTTVELVPRRRDVDAPEARHGAREAWADSAIKHLDRQRRNEHQTY
jgi:hypothetical protein